MEDIEEEEREEKNKGDRRVKPKAQKSTFATIIKFLSNGRFSFTFECFYFKYEECLYFI